MKLSKQILLVVLSLGILFTTLNCKNWTKLLKIGLLTISKSYLKKGANP